MPAGAWDVGTAESQRTSARPRACIAEVRLSRFGSLERRANPDRCIVRLDMKKLLTLVSWMALAACTKSPSPEFAFDKAASFADLKTFAWFDGEGFQFPRGGSIVDGRF